MRDGVVKHMVAVGVALGGGLVAVVLFFMAGSFSGRGEVGVLAGALLLFFLSWQIGDAFRPSRWYAGAVANVPLWALFLVSTDASQVRLYLPGLVFMLLAATAGSLSGGHAAARRGR